MTNSPEEMPRLVTVARLIASMGTSRTKIVDDKCITRTVEGLLFGVSVKRRYDPCRLRRGQNARGK